MDPGLRQWPQPDKMQGMNNGLEPMREPHMAAQGHVPLNNCWQSSRKFRDHHASERRGASYVQTPQQPAELKSSFQQQLGVLPLRASIEDTIDCDRSGLAVACS